MNTDTGPAPEHYGHGLATSMMRRGVNDRSVMRIRLDTLIDGYTINGAYQLGRSDELGSIEVGKQADLVILNQNLFEVSRYDVHKTRPVAVIMDGELVYGVL